LPHWTLNALSVLKTKKIIKTFLVAERSKICLALTDGGGFFFGYFGGYFLPTRVRGTKQKN
jgi:hypothetical protein